MHLNAEIFQFTKFVVECFVVDRWHAANAKVSKILFSVVGGMFKMLSVKNLKFSVKNSFYLHSVHKAVYHL